MLPTKRGGNQDTRTQALQGVEPIAKVAEPGYDIASHQGQRSGARGFGDRLTFSRQALDQRMRLRLSAQESAERSW